MIRIDTLPANLHEKIGAALGVMLCEAIKGFCFGVGALAALRLVFHWAGI